MSVPTPARIRLFDTLAGAKVPFVPRGDEVKLYVCGVTPYDTSHLGHGFVNAAFDVLLRYLNYLGHRVRYVQNITDVDDPLFDKAQVLGVESAALAREQTEQYLEDMKALNVLPADIYPRASQEIGRMIELVQTLLDAGLAYESAGRIYFSVAKDPEFGKLSKLDRTEMTELARERGGDPDDPRRRDPLDFVLWRPGRDGEPTFESPWGKGLPGWHIECSAMSLGYLGAPLDIHGGGTDLIFPHHECEVAQSEGVCSARPFVKIWMHSGMVYLDGEKMSKSLGNMVFVGDLVKEHGSDAVRLYLAGCHYRDDLFYDRQALESAGQLAKGLAASAGRSGGVQESDGINTEAFRARFEERMSDDLDTPAAIGVLIELSEAIDAVSSSGRLTQAGQDLLRELGAVLGLRLSEA
jgi:L-cysteine:1D-myo-inositol 2-amino-2-deoxy-alpha-D-glucopyranoside ligase